MKLQLEQVLKLNQFPCPFPRVPYYCQKHKKQKPAHKKLQGITFVKSLVNLTTTLTLYKLTSVKIKARLTWLKLLHLGRKHWLSSKIISQRQGSLYHNQGDEQSCHSVNIDRLPLQCTSHIHQEVMLLNLY